MLKKNLDTFEKQRSVHNHFKRLRSNIQKQTLALKGVIINYFISHLPINALSVNLIVIPDLISSRVQ